MHTRREGLKKSTRSVVEVQKDIKDMEEEKEQVEQKLSNVKRKVSWNQLLVATLSPNMNVHVQGGHEFEWAPLPNGGHFSGRKGKESKNGPTERTADWRSKFAYLQFQFHSQLVHNNLYNLAETARSANGTIEQSAEGGATDVSIGLDAQ